MTKIIAIALLLTLDGCASRWAEVDHQKCLSYGATPGSRPYVACRTQLDAARTSSVTCTGNGKSAHNQKVIRPRPVRCSASTPNRRFIGIASAPGIGQEDNTD